MVAFNFQKLNLIICELHSFLLRIAAAEAKAYGPEGEVEGDGCEDEGLCDAAAVDARVRRRLQSSD